MGPAGHTLRVASSERAVWLTVPPPPISQHRAARPARYSLASASFDGVSVANRGDDGFTPDAGRPWRIKLRVYTLRVRVREPLLGGRAPQVVVRSDAGVERSAPTDARGVALVRQLPRDLYSVSPQGGQAGPPAVAQVTRDQLIDVPSYSAAELAVGALGAVMAIAGAGLLALLARRRVMPLRTWARAHSPL